jgi:hypothetical protein
LWLAVVATSTDSQVEADAILMAMTLLVSASTFDPQLQVIVHKAKVVVRLPHEFRCCIQSPWCPLREQSGKKKNSLIH